METRLQKILSDMGIASRRKAEEMISEGRVVVNGKTATLGMKADPERDFIKVDGKPLSRAEPKLYLAFHKPREVMSTLEDPEGRATVKDFLKKIKHRVYPVGRLDYHSEGLLLVTNDGDFAHAALHPSKKVAKTYLVKVKGVVEDDNLERLRRGVRLADGMTQPARVKPVSKTDANSWLEITIHEGKKRQVRRMLETVGHRVLKLKRTSIGGVKLGGLEPGEFRHLTAAEIEAIRRAGGPESPKEARKR
jgi:23S rRNA pseudouridine2605 synthase